MESLQHSDRSSEAGKAAADKAVQRAKEISRKFFTALLQLDYGQLTYLAALSIFAACTLLFDLASFSVGVDYAVSETTAQAQRIAEAKLNSWAYSAFSSTLWGKLMWLFAISGIGVLIFETINKPSDAWVPLAQIGCAITAAMTMLLLLAIGFPDMSAYSDTTTSATLLGYWLPLIAILTASAVSVRRIL